MKTTIQSDASRRLSDWLTYNGFTIERKRGIDRVVVTRGVLRKRTYKLPLNLRLTAKGWTAEARASHDRHRTAKLNDVLNQFNEAERYISGDVHDAMDARNRFALDALPDAEVQAMADYYREQPPLTLNDIGRNKGQHSSLTALVLSMRWREAMLAEPARRDALFAEVS